MGAGGEGALGADELQRPLLQVAGDLVIADLLLERLGEQRLAEGGVVGGAVGDILQSWVHVAILPRPDPVAKGDNSPSSWGVTGSGP